MANYKFVQVAENKVRMYAKSNDFDPSGKGISFDGYITGSDICAVVQDANLLKVDVVLNTQNHTFLIDTNEDVITIAGTQHSPSTLTSEEAFDLLEGVLPNICIGEIIPNINYNADYQGVGDYSGVNSATGIGTYRVEVSSGDIGASNFNVGDIFYNSEEGVIKYLVIVDAGSYDYVNRGIWTAAKEATLVNNNVVIWNGKHYPVIDATELDGTYPNINTIAYGDAFDFNTSGLGYVEINEVSGERWNTVYERLLTVDTANDFADDTAAAAGNIPINGLYHTAGTVKIRLT